MTRPDDYPLWLELLELALCFGLGGIIALRDWRDRLRLLRDWRDRLRLLREDSTAATTTTTTRTSSMD